MESLNLIFDEKLLKEKLYPFDSPQRTSIKDDFFKSSAVLFTIIPHAVDPYELVVIHRSNYGLRHRGEMSFPGGKFESKYDKSLVDTVLRETEEEIGVPRNNIKILGCLHDFPTMSQYIISPFIGYINEDQPLIRDEKEVQAIVKVPIDFFIYKKKFRQETYEVEGNKFPVYFFDYKEKKSGKIYTIWGATAYMIATYIEMIYNLKISDTGLRRFNIYEIKTMKDILFRHNKTE
jgi:8-oxo-dGTP pyrophosphatase MutT (NUDIX family)